MNFQRALSCRVGGRGLVILASVGIGALLWETVYLLSGGIGFAHTWEVGLFLANAVTSLGFWTSLSLTAFSTLAGLVAGSLLAILMAIPLSRFPYIWQSSRSFFFFIRSIPSVALLPILLASLGSRYSLMLVLITWLVSTKVLFFAVRGFDDSEKFYVEQSKLLHLGGVHEFLYVKIPAASAIILMGLRLTVNRAYGGAVLGSLLAGIPGIGNEIQLARLTADYVGVLGLTVAAALLGVAFFQGLRYLETHTINWRPVA